MSKIDEMIERLCPDGVKFIQLGLLCNLFIGTFVKKTLQDDSYKYPVMNGGIAPTGYYDDKNSKAGSITISARGANCGFVNYVNTDFWAGNSCYVIKNLDDCVKTKYLFYCLKSVVPKVISSKKQTAGIPALNLKPLSSILIPVPPLEIQEEIVRVLDSFAELETELETELERRKAQYVYYLDKLLTFPNLETQREFLGKPVKWLTLGEIVDFINGRAYKKEELLEEGKYPVLRVGNFFSNDKWYYSDLELSPEKYCNKGDLLYAWSASFGPKIWDQEKTIFHYHIWRLEFDETLLLKKYLYYFLLNEVEAIKSSPTTTKSTMMHISMKEMKKRMVPVPPLEEQQRIVDILDKFDALVNDISQGLPAEIEARRKQYEYYRDKLLTFKEKVD